MNRNYEYDYEWDSRYCYPKSFVLKNKLGIRGAEQLRICGRSTENSRLTAKADSHICCLP